MSDNDSFSKFISAPDAIMRQNVVYYVHKLTSKYGMFGLGHLSILRPDFFHLLDYVTCQSEKLVNMYIK